MGRTSALVLAGRRGPADPLAESRGASHRALLEVNGVAMLLRVVRALRGAGIGRVTVSIDEPQRLEAVPELRALLASGEIASRPSLASPSRSVLDALERAEPGERLLVTTADHALLTPEMLEHFTAAADAEPADVVVGVVTASLLRAHYPESRRTFLWLRGEGYSGANLFAFQGPAAGRAAAFWVRAERYRKRPWRLVGAFGPWTLALFALRRLDLDTALARVSRAMGARVRPVILPFAEAAIDVDRAEDLALAEHILASRE